MLVFLVWGLDIDADFDVDLGVEFDVDAEVDLGSEIEIELNVDVFYVVGCLCLF